MDARTSPKHSVDLHDGDTILIYRLLLYSARLGNDHNHQPWVPVLENVLVVLGFDGSSTRLACNRPSSPR